MVKFIGCSRAENISLNFSMLEIKLQAANFITYLNAFFKINKTAPVPRAKCHFVLIASHIDHKQGRTLKKKKNIQNSQSAQCKYPIYKPNIYLTITDRFSVLIPSQLNPFSQWLWLFSRFWTRFWPSECCGLWGKWAGWKTFTGRRPKLANILMKVYTGNALLPQIKINFNHKIKNLFDFKEKWRLATEDTVKLISTTALLHINLAFAWIQ